MEWDQAKKKKKEQGEGKKKSRFIPTFFCAVMRSGYSISALVMTALQCRLLALKLNWTQEIRVWAAATVASLPGSHSCSLFTLGSDWKWIYRQAKSRLLFALSLSVILFVSLCVHVSSFHILKFLDSQQSEKRSYSDSNLLLYLLLSPLLSRSLVLVSDPWLDWETGDKR